MALYNPRGRVSSRFQATTQRFVLVRFAAALAIHAVVYEIPIVVHLTPGGRRAGATLAWDRDGPCGGDRRKGGFFLSISAGKSIERSGRQHRTAKMTVNALKGIGEMPQSGRKKVDSKATLQRAQWILSQSYFYANGDHQVRITHHHVGLQMAVSHRGTLTASNVPSIKLPNWQHSADGVQGGELPDLTDSTPV
ncbi:hypothetical protein FISHEDRAFT_58487 [Fistulina hepatica ATCC 64428]|uniref:Uncharacterized protein n=1 Tax=Fistulina hepatica ATCC 64428 TaxID=1128425 RepID=A0A0D7AE36_9AGAR|nr:hypothetical protein FISHEDRAFT_58487 [Fistulina hepatica ATCC 64428]